jgi:hypothetical protein
MNKKASSGDFIMWIPRIIITLFIVGAIVVVINNSIKSNLALEDLRFYPVAERLLYSDDCFALKENSRPRAGIIDINRFTNETIRSCMLPLLQDDPLLTQIHTGIKPSIGAKISLHYEQTDSSIYYNKEFYEDILPLTFSNLYMSVKKRYFVLVNDNDELKPGNLLIEVAWRK